MPIMEWMLIGVFLVAHFIWLQQIATRMLGLSSDHYFYLYYVGLVRENHHRFLYSFPNLLNPTPSGEPPYFYWLLSFVRSSDGLIALSRVINPALSTGLLLLYCVVLLSRSACVAPDVAPWLLVVLLALSPRSMHVANTRNYGLNTRGVGLLLFFLLAVFSYQAEVAVHPGVPLAVATIVACLIMGANIFAFQAAIFFSVLMGLLFGHIFMGLAVVAGMGLFFSVHPAHATHYMRNLCFYWKLYSNILADRFILAHRYSVWRDWVWDFWVKLRSNPVGAFFYMYANPVMVVLVLSPMTLLAVPAMFQGRGVVPALGSVEYSAKMSVVALAAFFLTSFRRTRFLGEPERYVEIAAPFSVVAGAHVIHEYAGAWGLGLYMAYAIGLTAFQGWYNFFLPNAGSEGVKQRAFIQRVRDEIDREFEGATIRFISNNGDWTKMLLNTRWQFVYFVPTVSEMGGIPIQELMDTYPMIKPAALERLMAIYKMNVCLLDKKEGGGMAADVRRSGVRVLSESAEHVLYCCDSGETLYAG